MKGMHSFCTGKDGLISALLYFFLICILTSLFPLHKLFAEESKEHPPATGIKKAPACKDPTSSLLWRIRTENSTVYLFGSIHIGARNFYPLNKKIEQAFLDSDHLVFEISPASMTDPVNAINVQTRSLLPNDQKLEDHISTSTIDDVESALNDFGLPADAYMGYRPWFLTMLLTNMQMISMGYMPQYGIEQYLFRKKPERTDILELETFESQMDLLESLDGETFLKNTLDNLEKGKKSIKELISAWKCSDKEALTALFDNEFDTQNIPDKKMKDLEENLLYKRNTIMAEGIETFLTEGEGVYFVVVGTAHYLGEKSIIKKLIKKGYRVAPVTL